MRVVYLAAGAAGMICGSCLRDNRLAATLRAAGRDVILIPLYTPLRTDEDSIAEGDVRFGGVNVYLNGRGWRRRIPRFVRRWLDHPVLLRSVGRFATGTRPADLGAMTVSMLSGREGPQAELLDELTASLRVLAPRIVNLPNLLFAGVAPAVRAALPGVRIVCTLGGEDLFVEGLPDEPQRQARALIRQHGAVIDRFLATSEYYRQRSIDFFGVPPDRTHAVPLGVDHGEAARADEPGEPFTLAYIGRVAPEKGLADAVDALLHLRRAGRDVRLVAGGWLGDPRYLAGIRASIAAAGAEDRFAYRGELSRAEKFDLLRGAHAFTMPSRYPEAKGLSIIEALGAGVPVVQPASGSFIEIVERTGGGLLYDPHAPHGLAEALARLVEDSELRRALGRRGAAAAREHYSHERMAAETWRHYEELHDGE